MKRLIIFLLLTLSILEVSEGIFGKKKSSNDVLPPGEHDKHKNGKCKWKKKKGKHTTTESPMEDLEPSLPKPGDSVLPGPYDPSSISKQIDQYFGPIWKFDEPQPPPNFGLPYFPTGDDCNCPSPHGNTKKPKNRRRRFLGCFGGGSSSEEGGGGYCPKHKQKSSKHKKGKEKKGKNKKGKGNQGGNGYGGPNDVYYDYYL